MCTFELVLRRPSDVTAEDVEFLSTADEPPDVGSTILDGEEREWVVTLIEPPQGAEHEARLICLPAAELSSPDTT
jgi:hypothetical protein